MTNAVMFAEESLLESKPDRSEIDQAANLAAAAGAKELGIRG